MNEKTNNSARISRFLPYLMRYKGILLFDLFCAALTTLCDIVLPSIMRYLTNAATDPSVVLTVTTVGKLAGLYLVLRIIDGAASYYMSGTGHIMGVYIETDMRRDAFAHLQRLSHTYYNNTKVGQIMGRITNDLFDVTEFAHHCPEEFFIAAIKIVASFVILCGASVPLTLVVFVCVPLMMIVSVRLNLRLSASSVSRLVSSTPPSRTACWASGWSRPLPPKNRKRTSSRWATRPSRPSRKRPTTPWPPSTLPPVCLTG